MKRLDRSNKLDQLLEQLLQQILMKSPLDEENWDHKNRQTIINIYHQHDEMMLLTLYLLKKQLIDGENEQHPKNEQHKEPDHHQITEMELAEMIEKVEHMRQNNQAWLEELKNYPIHD